MCQGEDRVAEEEKLNWKVCSNCSPSHQHQVFLRLSPSSSQWPCWRFPLSHHEGTIVTSSLVVRDTENKFPVPWVHDPQRSSWPLKDQWALNLSLFFFAPTSSPCLGYRCSLKYLPIGKQKGGPRECKMWEAWATPIRMGHSFLNWLNSGWLLPLSFPFLSWCCSCTVVWNSICLSPWLIENLKEYYPSE